MLVMKYSIKQLLFVIIILICQPSFGKNVNNLLFSLNNKIYTTIDLENRINYLRLINSTLTNYEEILDDYIKVIFFDQYYRNKNENENELFDIVNKYYKDLIKNNEKINSQNNYQKDIIFQQIKLDMQRKILIERELDKYRDLIFTDNISEINNIYNIYISYISIDKDTKEKLENLLNKKELENFLEVKRLLDENEFDYLFKTKKLNNTEKLDISIKEAIEKNYKNFILDTSDNFIIGKIDKIIKNDKNIDFRLLEIQTNIFIDNNLLKCENIENLKKNVGIKIVERNDIKYSSLNDYIKENMSSINDFILFKKDSFNIYVLLCDITYNNEYFDNININENIDLIVKKIENDLIFNKSTKYNFYLK